MLLDLFVADNVLSILITKSIIKFNFDKSNITNSMYFQGSSFHSSRNYGGFLRNSRKYRLGSLRKTPTEGNPPIGLGPS